MRVGRACRAIGLLVLLACDRPTEPSGSADGDLILRPVFAGAAVALDSGYILVRGATDRTAKVAAGSRTTISGLTPGEYTVALEGFTGDGVSHFGEVSGVQVVANQNTEATVTLSGFRPAIVAIPSYTTDGGVRVEFSRVARAGSYSVEWDSTPGFEHRQQRSVTDTAVSLDVAKTGPYFVRVRGVDPYGARGQSSEVKTVETLDTIVIVPTDHDTLIGVGDTLRFAARGQDAKGNLFDIATTGWASSNPAVTIDNDGLSTIVANGTTTITATETSGAAGTTSFRVDSLVATLAATISFSLASPPNHPMKLVSDGSAYYMIADGSAPSPIQTFTLAGAFLGSVDVALDARTLIFRPEDGTFYLKNFGLDWYEVDPSTGGATLLLPGIFQFAQSSPVILGDSIFEHHIDTLRVLALGSGQLGRTTIGLQAGGFPSSEALATDGVRLFTWDASTGTVFVYDRQGRRITSFLVSSGNWGFSLSYANGLLWTADDVGSGTSTWYGFQLTTQ